MAHHPPTRLALSLIAVLAAASLALVTARAADHEPPAKPTSKLSGPLVVLLEAFEEAAPAPVDYAAALVEEDSPSAAYITSGIVRVTGDGVQTYIHVAAIDDALRAALAS